MLARRSKAIAGPVLTDSTLLGVPLKLLGQEPIARAALHGRWTDEMLNPSKRDSYARKAVATARSILTYQIGLPEGCRRMSRNLVWLKPHETGLPTVFDEYLKEAQGLPLGSERLHWNRDVLQEKDVALEATNQRFRNQIFDTCWALIDRFAEQRP